MWVGNMLAFLKPAIMATFGTAPVLVTHLVCPPPPPHFPYPWFESPPLQRGMETLEGKVHACKKILLITLHIQHGELRGC